MPNAVKSGQINTATTRVVSLKIGWGLFKKSLEAMPRVGVKHQGSKCKCGSTTHSHTSHRDCPLKKK